MPTTGSLLVEDGNFESLGLPDLLVRVWKWSFSGSVRIDHRKVLRILTFKDGDILGVSTDRTEDSIEEFIRRSGRLSPEQMAAALERKSLEEDTAIAFVRSGLLTAREADEIVRQRIVEILTSILAMGADGTYKVQPSKIEWEGPTFQTSTVLLDAILACTDRHWIADRLPMESVLQMVADPGGALALAPEDAAPILRLTDGENSVEDICRSSSRDNFFVCKFLYAMELLGALQRMQPLSEKKRGRRLIVRKEDGTGTSLADQPTDVLDSLAARHAPHRRPRLAAPLVILLLIAVGAAAAYWWRRTRLPAPPPPPNPPTFFAQAPPGRKSDPVAPQTQQTQPAAVIDPAYAAIQAGDMDTAVALSRERLLKAGLNLYSIVLETDCLPSSVEDAYRQASADPALFVVATMYRGKKCYNVCWGLYRTWMEAQTDSRNLPQYFRNQGGHKIVLLADLLVSD